MDSTSTVKALAALAQETRLAVFRLLVEQGPEGLTPGRIAEALDLPAATLSFHLKELANAGLIRARAESRFIHYSADFQAMNGLVGYLTENCCRASGGCESACAPDCMPAQTTPRRVSTRPSARTPRVAQAKRRAA
jgi:ArsR family transcriptional regulator, arsenate/arsenite/antimonite-responsive transcriptional repressor